MFYFIRHGERADCSLDNQSDIDNKQDPQITRKGVEQALSTGKWLFQNKQKYVILTSPFLRCVMTAQAIAQELGINNIHVQQELSECLYPQFFTTDPIPQLINNKIKCSNKINLLGPLFTTEISVTYPEKPCDVYKRIEAFMEVLSCQGDLDTTYINITHQRPVKIVLESMQISNLSPVDYCSVAAYSKRKEVLSDGCCYY